MPNTSTPKRQRRDQRPKSVGRMNEMPRDRQIIQWVYNYRILSQRQLEQLLGKSRSTVQQTLVRLYNHRYLERVFPAVNAFGSSPTFYILDIRGKEVLQEMDVNDFSGQPSKHLSDLFLRHTAAINDVRIAVTQACEQVGWEVPIWKAENDLKTNYDRVSARTSAGKLQDVPIVPDSYFTISVSGRGTGHFFLELDRGKMTLKRYRNKIVGYTIYYKRGGFETRYKTKGFRVLTVVDTSTEGTRRVENLMAQTVTVPGIGRRFWFTHLSRITPETILSQPIWQVAGDTEPAPLFQRV